MNITQLQSMLAKDGETYSYLINNANFESFIKVIKVDAETGNTIPYAGAGFQIFRPDSSKVEMTFTYPEVTTIDTFYTNDAGMLITPEKLEFGKGYHCKIAFPQGGASIYCREYCFDLICFKTCLHFDLACSIDLQNKRQVLADFLPFIQKCKKASQIIDWI